MAGIAENLRRVRQSMSTMSEQDENLTLLNTLEKQIKELQEKAQAITVTDNKINVLTEQGVQEAITALRATHGNDMQKVKQDLSKHIRREYLAGKIE